MIDKIERSILAFTILGLFAMMCLCNVMMLNLEKIEANKIEPVLPIYEAINYEEKEKEEIVVVVEKTHEDIIEETEEEILEEIKVLEGMLTASLGRIQGPVEEETWYNLPMNRVIDKMRENGYSEMDYPYWIREDGVKMLGDFIMVAADLEKYPRGTVVETSLGQGLICDECEHGEEFDIAVDW